MTTNSILKTLALSFLIATTGVCSAHQGGHYHKGDGTVFSQWHTKDGIILKGNYHTGNSKFIELEQEEGKLLKIELEKLTDKDKQTALETIQKFKTFNEPDQGLHDITIPQH